MDWVYDDGGRSKYFEAENVGDCVTRAVAIATEQDYKKVYNDMAALNKKRYGKKTARHGVHRDDIKAYMAKLGWVWHPTMSIGSGCTTHLRKSELPSGRVVCSLSKHIVAVVDGEVHDTYDSTRGGNRCVYGYWTPPKADKPAKKLRAIGHEEFRRRVEQAADDFEAGYISAEEFGRVCERTAGRRFR